VIKPWIVDALQVGMAAACVLAPAAALFVSPRPGRLAGYCLAVLLAVAAALAIPLGSWVPFAGTVVLCVTMYGLGRAWRYHWWAGVLASSAALVFPAGPVLALALLHFSDREQVLLAEDRLSSDVVCRAYVRKLDSVEGTRVLLIRERPFRLRDDVLRELRRTGPGSAARVRCRIDESGQVSARLWDRSGAELDGPD
jgi:hypothetical protein